MTINSEEWSDPRSQSEGLPTIYDGDWQHDSIMLFADQVCKWLREDDNAQSPTEATLCRLIRDFIGAMELYYNTGLNLLEERPPDSPRPLFDGKGLLNGADPLAYERRRMIQIIGAEWDDLMSMVATARFLDEQAPVLDALHLLIAQARSDLNMATIKANLSREPDSTDLSFMMLPHFGRDFELVSFKYAPGIFVLGVPVTSLYCPWNWTVIWHEVAAIYIQSERKLREARGAQAGVVAAVYNALATLDDRAGRRNLRAGYSDWLARNQLMDRRNRLRLDEQVRWGWAEELVEDAIGVICLGEAMADVLDRVLRDVYAPRKTQQPATNGTVSLNRADRRHPPPELRIAVARSLAYLLSGRPAPTPGSYADTIAGTILPHAGRMVARPWSAAEEQLYRTNIIPIEKGEWRDEPDKADFSMPDVKDPAHLRVRYALAASAVHRGLLDGNSARQIFFPEMSQRAPASKPDLKSLGLDRVSRDEILEQTFSERDQARVTITEHESHTGGVSVHVELSRTVHGANHHHEFDWTHPHPH